MIHLFTIISHKRFKRNYSKYSKNLNSPYFFSYVHPKGREKKQNKITVTLVVAIQRPRDGSEICGRG